MKYFSLFLLVVALTLGALTSSHADSRAATVRDDLRGFTPTLSISLSLRDPYFQIGTATTTASVKVDGPADAGTKSVTVKVTGPAGTDQTVTVTLNGEPGSNQKDVTVNLPETEGEARYTASATVDDKGLSNSDSTTGYTWSLSFDKSEIAAGSGQTGFVLSASVEAEGLAAPSLSDVSENKDAHNTSNASFAVADEPSDDKGKISGTLTAGNRIDSTKVQVALFSDASRNPNSEVSQVWNPSGSGWAYPNEFEIDEAVEISYSLAMPDGPISGHDLQFRPTSIKGEEWNEKSGEDWDGDGEADGDYDPVEYSEGDPPVEPTEPGEEPPMRGFDKWSGLIAISGKAEVSGKYAADMTVSDDYDFFVTEAGFGFYDKSVRSNKPKD